MDIADIANTHEQVLLQKTIESIRSNAEFEASKGHCLNCGEPCTGRFCSVECRNDYERVQKILQKQGKLKNDGFQYK